MKSTTSPQPLPDVEPAHQAEWEAMLSYFGLEEPAPPVNAPADWMALRAVEGSTCVHMPCPTHAIIAPRDVNAAVV